MRAKAAVEAGDFSVLSVEKRRVKRNPPPPFTTSTLQQEASRKLGFGAQQAMRTAQQLYEGVEIGGETVGLITYMRTDGVQMAREAIAAIRDHVGETFGRDYLPGAPREYSSPKAKNAQEAHEAIRPTDVARTPENVARYLDDRSAQALRAGLEARRGVADAVGRAGPDHGRDRPTAKSTILRATGSVIAFDGFLSCTSEDDSAADARPDHRRDDAEAGRILPPMARARSAEARRRRRTQHFTQPPPRFSEASLVKKMEELGIGRPPPTPPSCRPCRTATTSSSTSGASSRRTAAGWSPPS